MLVLVWQFLVIFGVLSIDATLSDQQLSINVYLLSVATIPLGLVAIISGWLADTKVGRSRVVQTGLFLTWLGVGLLTGANILTLSVHTTSNTLNSIVLAVQYVALCATYGGAAVFFTNVAQFGLEQMPDASSDAMTAFISWMVIVTFIGEGAYATVRSQIVCRDTGHMYSHAIRSCIGCALLSVAMCSKFLFSYWLIDHRQNHHPLKTVYRILKFAKQHKYPVNRSAFTYCEDEIPSRIDLGKSKYGGPFTTEEVEDVKTFFRILLILILISAYLFAIYLLYIVPLPYFGKSCLTILLNSFEGFFTAVVFLAYDYLVYPFIKVRYRLSTLKKIGLCMFYGVLLAVILFVYTMLTEIASVDLNSILIKEHHLIHLFFDWLTQIVFFIFYTSIIEFICSQAPEHMKGFFLFWTWLVVVIVILTSTINPLNCSQYKYCGVYLTSVAVLFSLLVFVVYCCVARWYKRRERDEPCNERARIKEIYGRHVEHNVIEENSSD